MRTISVPSTPRSHPKTPPPSPRKSTKPASSTASTRPAPAFLCPSERLAEARLALAGAGLPRTGRIGFELFDSANLGASDFTEQVNYRRALEGELERTVSTLSEVDQARIHITFAKESVFLDARQPAKATVVLS